MTTPVIEPTSAPEAPPEMFNQDEPSAAIQSMPRPFRLNLLGLGAALALFGRLAAANGYGDLDNTTTLVVIALSSALIGLSLLLTAAERDRIGAPVVWISLVTSGSWAVLNWISPPFADGVTAFDTSSQPAVAAIGAGNGVVLAGIVTLALVRRGPTLTVAAALLASVASLASTTVLLRAEWPAIGFAALAFLLWLLAWDRAPRREHTFELPEFSPRFSRAALSLISVLLCGTALQLWISRSSIPRSLPAVLLAGVLVGAAFASMWRVRREIEQRETMVEEWRNWMREIRHNDDFRAEMQSFESSEPPRQLSFPNLVAGDDSDPAQAAPHPTAPHTTPLDETLDATPLGGHAFQRPATPDLPAAAAGDPLLDSAATGWLDVPKYDAPAIEVPTAPTSSPVNDLAATTPTITDAPDLGTPPTPSGPDTADVPPIDIAPIDIAAASPTDVPPIDIAAATPTITDAPDLGTPPTPSGPDTADVPPIDIAPIDIAAAPVVDIAAAAAAPTVATPPSLDTPEIDIPDLDSAPAADPGHFETAATLADLPVPDPVPAPQLPADTAAQAATPEVVDEPASASPAGGAFSSMVAQPAAPDNMPTMQSFATLDALDAWLAAPESDHRVAPLLLAMEVMALEEYDAIPALDAADATEQIGAYLSDRLPPSDLIAWIDGPYFIAAYSTFPTSDIPDLNKTVTGALKATEGTHAFVRPGAEGQLDDLVEQAVLGLLHARRNQQVMARR